jgi:hypothetical protein
MAATDSPYPVGGTVTDPRLLQIRRVEVGAALDAVAPTNSLENRHAAILGEARSGRSSVLVEVARRAAEERERLVVWLRGDAEVFRPDTLARHLLTAIAESLADHVSSPPPPWYLAWRDRAYLRDRGASTERDLLSSALVFAGDPDAEIDRAILERDLAALWKVARDIGLAGIVICIDDASVMTEDVALVEELLRTVDAVGGYSLLLAGLPIIGKHFIQAASPCVARFRPVRLRPFRGPYQVYVALSAPLNEATEKWLPRGDTDFLVDVLQLTGGNPYEVMLVGHHLWLTCQRGEQDGYRLTPRVLDRVIPHLALLASGGDALLTGAHAIDNLADDHVRQAVELVALSGLTLREIAIARILKINDDHTRRLDRAILTADIDEEAERALNQLTELERAGVIQLHDDQERFNVLGGRAAAVLLKYKARARIGADVSSLPFGLPFVLAVGIGLARDASLGTLQTQALEGAESIGRDYVMSLDGAGRLSPRPAVRNLSDSGGIERLVHAEIDLTPWSQRCYERVAELLIEDEPAVALVYVGLTHDRGQLEYVELWELPAGVSEDDVRQAWSDVAEEWQPVLAAADVKWAGSEFAALRGEGARQALVVLEHTAAKSAVHLLFDRWIEDRDGQALSRAQQIAVEAVATMRESGLSDRELGGELSAMLSRVGFLKSFDDALLHEARAALEDALRTGAADGWVTKWNLSNVAARLGDRDGAHVYLEEVSHDIKDRPVRAFILFFVPGRSAADCLVSVSNGAEPVLELQRVVLAMPDDPGGLVSVIDDCRATGDAGAIQAADWVAESLAPTS